MMMNSHQIYCGDQLKRHTNIKLLCSVETNTMLYVKKARPELYNCDNWKPKDKLNTLNK